MNRFFASVLTFFVSLFFFACSSSDANILSVMGTVVFEYADTNSAPTSRLSVFVQTENEAQRAESLKITNRKNRYTWYVSSPILIGSSSRQWVGYSFLEIPPETVIPSGTYDVEYTDSAGSEATATFSISYKQELLSSPCTEIRNIVKGILTENTILYDDNMNMLYYGKKKSTWKSNKNILRDYNKAVYMRYSLGTPSNSLLFLYPLEDITDKETDAEVVKVENND